VEQLYVPRKWRNGNCDPAHTRSHPDGLSTDDPADIWNSEQRNNPLDVNTHLSHVQRERTGSYDLHLRSTRDGVVQVRPEDLRLLKLTSVEHAERIVRRYGELDWPKVSEAIFAQHLLQRTDSWFVEAGDIGLIYLTDVIPEFHANLNVVFWDQKLHRNRIEVTKTVLAEAFEKFALQKISAAAPVTNHPLRSFYAKAGFVLEGCLRRMWPSVPPVDLAVYGMLKEELPWQLVLRTTSLA